MSKKKGWQIAFILENTPLTVAAINAGYAHETGEEEPFIEDQDTLDRFVREGWIAQNGNDIEIWAEIY